MKPKLIKQLMTIAIVTLMIGCSEVFHEKEFIFPEITALTVGAWLAPKQVWKVSKVRLVILIALYASLGIILVRYIPISQYAKILIAFSACLMGLYLSRTTFAPLISAAILPIIIGSDSWLYPLFATTMSILIVLGRKYLEQDQEYIYVPVQEPLKPTFILGLKRLIAVALITFLALTIKLPLMIAPPLMVAFVELSSNHPKLRHNLKNLFIVTVECAFIGAYVRLCLSPLPLTLMALLIVILMLAVMEHRHTYFPPAGALAILPLLIAERGLVVYPFAIMGGFILFAIMAIVITKINLTN